MTNGAILFSEMRPEKAWEDRFNTWYDTEHIPVRMVLDGFVGAQRYKALENDNYLVVYDMESMAALKTPGYDKVKNQPSDETRWMLSNVSNFTRNLGTEIGREGNPDPEAPYVFCALFDVPAEAKPDFDAWMTGDHMPHLLKNKDWLGVRRFDLTVAEPDRFTRLAIHYLASLDALKSPERAAARDTKWRADMVAKHDWFSRGYYGGFSRLGPRYPHSGG
jgi:hypothetical protein